jgi:hypothetical protein
METDNTKQLLEVLAKYAVPDPKIVGKLPKGGAQLDFVGHADITRILIEIDPHWRLVPIAWDNGRPAMNIVNDMATMWFELTLLGCSRLAIGSAKANAFDLDKQLYGDALRNGAMRFGISLNLWTKNEWEDLDHNPTPASKPKLMPAGSKPKPQVQQPRDRDYNEVHTPSKKPAMTTVLSEEQIKQFTDACNAKGVDPKTVAKNAGIDEGRAWTQADLVSLRAAFKELVAFKEGQ